MVSLLPPIMHYINKKPDPFFFFLGRKDNLHVTQVARTTPQAGKTTPMEGVNNEHPSVTTSREWEVTGFKPETIGLRRFRMQAPNHLANTQGLVTRDPWRFWKN